MNATAQYALLWLWQASCQVLIVLAVATWLAGRLTQPAARARLLHAGLLCCALCPLTALLLPRLILLPQALPVWLPLVDVALAPRALSGSLLDVIAMPVVGLWAAGVCWHALRIGYGWWSIRRLLRLSTTLDDERIRRIVAAVDGAPTVELRTLPGLPAPFCWQIHRPMLVLPESLSARSDEELCWLLRHELAHLRSGDPLRLYVEHCIAAVFWFHPLVHWVIRRCHNWREIACDEWALAGGGSPHRFASLLTELAAHAVMPASDAWKLSAGAVSADLRQRVLCLTGDRPAARPEGLFSWLAPLLLLASAGTLAILRLAPPVTSSEAATWTPWPPVASQLLDAAGVQTIDYDLHRAAHDPREQRPEHRAAHRKWSPQVHDSR